MHLKNSSFAVLGLLLIGSTAEAVSLRGSSDSLDKQMAMARKLHLPHIKNTEQIIKLMMRGQLRELPRQGETFYLDEQIGECDPMHAHLYRTASPATIQFLSKLSRKFYNKFDGTRFKVTSLTRTVGCQKWLQRHNTNATAVSRSAHLTGSAIDISYKEMTTKEVRWMQQQLMELEKKHLIEATEEHHQACFHVMVFRE